MKREFLDPEYIRSAVEEETLRVKTGIRAGISEPPPPWPLYGIPTYGIPLYGIEPSPVD